MKLNADCMRQMLFALEEKPLNDSYQTPDFLNNEKTKEFSADDIVYSAMMLDQQGLIDARIHKTYDGTTVLVHDLTSSGHAFLEEIYGDTKWNTIKETLKEDGLPTSISAITKTIARLTLK